MFHEMLPEAESEERLRQERAGVQGVVNRRPISIMNRIQLKIPEIAASLDSLQVS